MLWLVARFCFYVLLYCCLRLVCDEATLLGRINVCQIKQQYAAGTSCE